ncbi:class I glutamine amidotransferase-like protein [Periconia macrospinosa]|uniref:Class I glutamine amidotransferase-like protein n=1 Tax=Periconia macrospinosa TaxID=97972 RepID=A0A2V1E9T3_9PLEO|nr:class I glutamine amidotransferase-like protein [Periconia macrospinosa]
MAHPKVMILMADYGHDPTETSIPWKQFKEADFSVSFATEQGARAACDSRMLEGMTGMFLGAAHPAKTAYKALETSTEFQSPLSWTDPSFTLLPYDLVFLPGGHDKAVRQVIDSARVHELLAEYFPLTRAASSDKKCVAAVCHGVQVLSKAKYADTGKSVLHDVTTTALTSFMEQSIYQATRLFLGDYYKTYGAGTPSVEEYVRRELDDPDTQFKSSMSFAPFVVKDDKYNYISARFPGDVEEFGKAVVEAVERVLSS